MTFPTDPLKQNGTPPTGAVGLKFGPRKATGGLTVKIPALDGVEYARLVVLIKTITAIAIAILRNFLTKYTPYPRLHHVE